jgi:GntR family transcriptional repressor for pyruvate dehydrogenase complex
MQTLSGLDSPQFALGGSYARVPRPILGMMGKKKLPTDSRQVVQRLVEHIRSQGLSVGDRLPSIRQLAGSMKVSPSLVRDAMVQAQAMGLIKLHPRSGAFVQSLNFAPMVDALAGTLPTTLMQRDHNLIYLLDARRIIELEVAAQAAQRRRLEDLLPMRLTLETMGTVAQDDSREEFVEADIQFHVALAHAAGNPVLAMVVESLLGCLRPYLANLPWTQERRIKTQRSHEEIYEAVLAGNPDRARNSVQQHLGLAREGLLHEVQAPFRTG